MKWRIGAADGHLTSGGSIDDDVEHYVLSTDVHCGTVSKTALRNNYIG